MSKFVERKDVMIKNFIPYKRRRLMRLWKKCDSSLFNECIDLFKSKISIYSVLLWKLSSILLNFKLNLNNGSIEICSSRFAVDAWGANYSVYNVLKKELEIQP